jgi:DNA-directed RNA polymerase specialized sigma24 family protein
MPLIEQILQQFPEDQRSVRFSFDLRDNGYQARAILALPTGNLIAQTDAPLADPHAAVDRVVDKLADQVRHHQARLRREDRRTQSRRREGDFTTAEPLLSRSRRTNDREAFFDILLPLLRQLQSHARHELTLAELDGTIPSGEITVDDLLDEVLLRAWDRWDQRARNKPLDRWLIRLLHETLEPWGFEPPDRKPRLLRRHEPSETIDAITPEDVHSDSSRILEAAIQRQIIMEELSKFPRRQRQAFTFHVLEGWDIPEIAFAQDRSEDEVRADIEAVSQAIRQRLEAQSVSTSPESAVAPAERTR